MYDFVQLMSVNEHVFFVCYLLTDLLTDRSEYFKRWHFLGDHPGNSSYAFY